MRTAYFLAAAMAVAAPLAHADDMAEVISKYRKEHGLSTVKTDPELTKIAERQAKAMAASGIMDHSVAGAFSSRISGAHITGMAAENIAAGSKSWDETMQMWKTSWGHNANLLQSQADTVGVAFARNDATRYKTYWAMVIADKSPKKKGSGNKFADEGGPFGSSGHSGSYASLGNPITAVKNFVCKYLC
jgi:hypothetical protein